MYPGLQLRASDIGQDGGGSQGNSHRDYRIQSKRLGTFWSSGESAARRRMAGSLFKRITRQRVWRTHCYPDGELFFRSNCDPVFQARTQYVR